MGEPISVEVVCPACAGTGRDPHYGSGGLGIPPKQWSCIRCLGRGTESLPTAPGSLTEAMMQLAEAAEEMEAAEDHFDLTDGAQGPPQDVALRCQTAMLAYRAALARVRELRGRGG